MDRTRQTNSRAVSPFHVSHLQVKLACSAALLAFGMTAVVVGARLGVVHLDAGDMTIVFGGGDNGVVMDIASRGCPPECNVNVDWRPVTALSASGL